MGSPMCARCLYGQFQPDTGQWSCLSCPEGWFGSANGLDLCQRCAKGTFSSIPGAETCESAPTGKYQDKITAVAPVDCPSGWSSPAEGLTACLECNVGTFSPVASHQCILALRFLPRLQNASSCKACEMGKAAAGQGTSCVAAAATTDATAPSILSIQIIHNKSRGVFQHTIQLTAAPKWNPHITNAEISAGAETPPLNYFFIDYSTDRTFP